jgi:hypothetical protein
MATERTQESGDTVQNAAESIAKARRKMRKAGIADVPDQEVTAATPSPSDPSGPVAKPITERH